MTVAGADEAGGGLALFGEAGEFGGGVIDDDSFECGNGDGGFAGRALVVEDLLVGEKSGFELGGVDVLHGDFLIDGLAGSGGGRLAEDHEDRFHADGAEGDVGGGKGGGDEEVLALFFLRPDGAVGDLVGAAGGDLDVAFIAGVAVFVDVALDVVGVHVVGAHANGHGGLARAEAVGFGLDVVADHAAGFADVDLVWPVSVVGELVFGEAPFVDFFAEVGGDAGVVAEEPEEAFLVDFVFFDDGGAGGVVAIGVVVVHPDVIGGESAVVVGIGLAVGHVLVVAPDVAPSLLDVAEVEFVAEGVVAFGFGEGNAVGGVVGEAHAEAVGLDAVVAGAFGAGVAALDAREESAFGIAGDEEGVDVVEELVGAGVVGLDAVEGFSVFGIGFAPDGVCDAGLGHEVTFVGGIDEYFSAEGVA